MANVIHRFTATIIFVGLATAVFGQDQQDVLSTNLATHRIGHSLHGSTFDEGPRKKPWKIEGIGKTHFPITAAPEVREEVQAWFDQGNTLLHSYWFYEAERSFRWCLKLDPECAMAYWGLYRCLPGTNPTSLDADKNRARGFLVEASKRKHKVSERERLYIEAWEARVSADAPGFYSKETIEKHAEFKRRLERIILKYPDDLEAKALYANENLPSLAVGNASGQMRYANEALIQEVLHQSPNHPGALHYRIHNWDGPDGWYALDSCAKYSQVAPNVGHALHMPGHVYASQGMWHEAAVATGSATRLELKYMQQRMVFVFHDWNYAHNLNYFCYVLQQLGRPDEALSVARPVLSAPLDPKYNNPDHPDRYFTPFREGLASIIRVLVSFERWDNIVEPGFIPWRNTLEDRIWKSYVEALAYVAKGDVDKATTRRETLKGFQADAERDENEYRLRHFQLQLSEVDALLSLAKGRTEDGLKQLGDTAALEIESRGSDNDPPYYPRVLYNVFGNALLRAGRPKRATEAFEKTLAEVPNNGIALAGLVKSHAALKDMETAAEHYARLLHVWSDAEAGLPFLDEVRRLGLDAKPKDTSPKTQRRYSSQGLDNLGTEIWKPFKAPNLAAVDSQRRKVDLSQFRGKNVLLVFFLGEECVHCMEQLVAVNEQADGFAQRNTQVLAISGNTPQENAASEKLRLPVFRLLSDEDHSNARRFQSYDDFEEMELHSTILIDSDGFIRWARTGGDPFMDIDFLFSELDRLNGQ